MRIARGSGSLAVSAGLVLLAGAVAGVGAAGRATLDPEHPGLGQDARLVLDTAPADSTQFPVGVGVMVWPTDDAKVFRTRTLRVGKVGIAFPASQDTMWWEVPRHIEKADPSLLRPLEHTGGISPSWWRQIVALVVGLVILGLLLRRFVRRTAPVAPVGAEVREPPHRIALRRLTALEHSGWLAEGRYDDWFVEGSHALREYVGGRYRVAALDWTSGELVTRLVAAGYPREELAAVEPLLHQADGVKFARSKPTDHQAQSWLQEIVEFVQRTAVDVVYSTPEAMAASRRLNEGAIR